MKLRPAPDRRKSDRRRVVPRSGGRRAIDLQEEERELRAKQIAEYGKKQKRDKD
jgi:hypothetical protein